MNKKTGYHRNGGSIDRKQWETMLLLRNVGVKDSQISEITGWAKPTITGVLKHESFDAYEQVKRDYAASKLEGYKSAVDATAEVEPITTADLAPITTPDPIINLLTEIRDLLAKRRIF